MADVKRQVKRESKKELAKRDKQTLGLLVLTLLFGLMLRTAGLTWSLPDARHPLATYHPDELINLSATTAADIPHLQLDIKFYNYGTLYFYLVSFAQTLGRGWGLIPTTPNGYDAFSPQAAPEQAALFLTGRIVTALLGTATIAVIYALGRRLYGRKAGLLASLLYAVTPIAVQHAHFLTVDVPATFFVALALLGAARLLTRQTWTDYVLAGVWVGLAAATKYNTALVLIAPLLAHRFNKNPNACQTHRAAHFFVMLAAAGFAFLVACPGPVINFDAFWNGTYPGSGVRYELFEHSRNGHGDLFTNTGLGWVYHLTTSLRYGMGTPLLLLSLAGIGHAAWKRRPEDVLLLSFVLLYYGLAGFSAVRFARYMIPLFPAFSVLAARFAIAPFPRPIVGKIMAALAGVAILCAFGSSATLALQMLDADPRDEVAEYLKICAPAGATVAFAKIPWFYSPPLSALFGAPAAPLRAKAAEMTTRYHLIMPKSEWDLRVLSPTPDYLILSDLESGNAVYRLHEPAAAQFMRAVRAAPLAEVNWHWRLTGGSMDAQFPHYFFGSEPWNAPEDMRYADPVITLYEK